MNVCIICFQLLTEKGNHIKLKRAHEDLKNSHDKLQMEFEKISTELELIKLDVNKSQQTENQYKSKNCYSGDKDCVLTVLKKILIHISLL